MAAGPEQARSETALPLTRHAAGEAPVGDAVVERGEVDGPGGDPDRLGTSGRAVRRMGLPAESGSSGERNGVTGFLAIGGAHAQAGAGPAVAAVPTWWCRQRNVCAVPNVRSGRERATPEERAALAAGWAGLRC